jgi:PAS domain-containing protein
VPLLLLWTGSLFLASSVLISILLGHTIFLAAVGGELALFPGWLVPLFAVLLQGARAGVVWSVLTFACVAGVAIATAQGVALPVPEVEIAATAKLRGALALIGVSLTIGLAYEWLKNHALREMDDAQRRAAAAHGKQVESERRFRTLTENATDVITEWDATGRVHYISSQITTITGQPPEA